MRTWTDRSASFPLQRSFESALVGDWQFIKRDRVTGELLWSSPLGRGFSLELGVHPVSQTDEDFVFQTTAYLVSANLCSLVERLGFSGCLPSSGGTIPNPRGVLVSFYLEGLQWRLNGGTVQLFAWNRNSGINDLSGWQALFDMFLTFCGKRLSDLNQTADCLLELDRVNKQYTPSPLVLYEDPYVLAAIVSLLLDREAAAATYLQRRTEGVPAQNSSRLSFAVREISDCKAQRMDSYLREKAPGVRSSSN